MGGNNIALRLAENVQKQSASKLLRKDFQGEQSGQA